MTRTRTRRVRFGAASTLAVLTSALVLAPAAIVPAFAVQIPASCPTATALINGGFELPAETYGEYGVFHQDDVLGWMTTATDGMIEIWSDGFNGVPAGSGAQFAELNANEVATLYQDVDTIPGQSLKWQLQHRGRTGVDVMRVLIGAPAGPLVQQGADIANGMDAWGTHSGFYTVPLGQTTTRFAFESVSDDPSASYGNLLDSVFLGTPSCVVLDKSVVNVTRPGEQALAADTLTYTVTATNHGGTPAQLTLITDSLHPATTFVSGSLRDSTGALTDDAGDDTGEFDAGVITVRVGDGATATDGGTIAAGESVSVQFDVTINAGAEGALANFASATYLDTFADRGCRGHLQHCDHRHASSTGRDRPNDRGRLGPRRFTRICGIHAARVAQGARQLS